jgi:hypothetical protein
LKRRANSADRSRTERALTAMCLSNSSAEVPSTPAFAVADVDVDERRQRPDGILGGAEQTGGGG